MPPVRLNARHHRAAALASVAAASLIVAGASTYTAPGQALQVAGTTPAATTPAPVPPIQQNFKFDTKAVKGTRVAGTHRSFTKLSLSGVLGGDLVKVSCAGHGCDGMKTKRFTIAEGKTSINLISAVRGSQFSNGAEVRVKTARAGTRSRIFRVAFTLKKG